MSQFAVEQIRIEGGGVKHDLVSIIEETLHAFLEHAQGNKAISTDHYFILRQAQHTDKSNLGGRPQNAHWNERRAGTILRRFFYERGQQRRSA